MNVIKFQMYCCVPTFIKIGYVFVYIRRFNDFQYATCPPGFKFWPTETWIQCQVCQLQMSHLKPWIPSPSVQASWDQPWQTWHCIQVSVGGSVKSSPHIKQQQSADWSAGLAAFVFRAFLLVCRLEVWKMPAFCAFWVELHLWCS